MKRLFAVVILFVTALSSLLFSMKSGGEKPMTSSFGFNSYSEIYDQAKDSLISTSNTELICYLDSLFYFCPDSSRFVSCLHKSFSGKRFADEMSFVYGEKISGRWFFFEGEKYLLPRALYNKNDSLPLNYSQFHTTALEDIFYPFALSGNFDFRSSPFFREKQVANNGGVKNKF